MAESELHTDLKVKLVLNRAESLYLKEMLQNAPAVAGYTETTGERELRETIFNALPSFEVLYCDGE